MNADICRKERKWSRGYEGINVVREQKKIQQILADECRVAGYLSYREYLKDALAVCQSHLVNFSHKDFSELCGFARTNNIIRLIITGHRVLTLKSAKTVASGLGLKFSERRYFLLLVEYANQRVPVAREEIFQKLIQLRREIDPNLLHDNQLEYFQDWFNPIIRELMALERVDTSPEGVQSALSFPLRLDEIKRSLDLLQRLGFITYDRKRGRFEPSKGHVSTEEEVDSIAITRYHQKMIEMAKESLTRIHEDYRSINAVTVSLSLSAIPVLKEKINRFLDEILELEDDIDNPSDVYQLNVQLFPFTKPDEDS